MPKNSERGSLLLILLFIFLAIGVVVAVGIFRILSDSTQKISQNNDELTVALKSDYQNPFEEETQYVNPFDEYQNPFDNLK